MGESLGAFRWPAQSDEWYPVEIMDQWGRVWGCTWDGGKNARAPVSALVPVGWHDRLTTPPKYFHFTKGRSDKFVILVDAWVADLEFEHEQYAQRINMEAMAMSSVDAGGALLGADPFGERGPRTVSDALIRRVGPPPNALAPIRALQLGNKYVLGLSDKMPQWAKPYFTPQRPALTEFPDAEDEASADEAPEPTVEDVQRALGASEAYPDVDDEESPLAALTASAAAGGKRRR